MSSTSPTSPKRLLDRVIEEIRLRHYSPRTELAYLNWIRRYVRFNGNRHPSELGRVDMERYLTHLAVEREVSASTQGQALAALIFLYGAVLRQPIEDCVPTTRARRTPRVAVDLTPSEVQRLLDRMTGQSALMAAMLYGSGLRLPECVRLRVKDLDLARAELRVRRGKCGKDRVVPIAAGLIEPLRRHLLALREQHVHDLRRGVGWVEVPDALRRKDPNAGHEWTWQWVFPATRRHLHRPTNEVRRHHFHATALQKAVHRAALSAQIDKRVSCQSLRHSFATHLRELGYDLRTIQELLGRQRVSITGVDTQVLNRGKLGVSSPFDKLALSLRLTDTVVPTTREPRCADPTEADE